MTAKDTIAMPLVCEALQQSCPPGSAEAFLRAAGIAPAALRDPDARVPAGAYAALWRALAHAHDDEFFGMDSRPLRAGSFAFLCGAALERGSLAESVQTLLAFLNLMLGDFHASLIRQDDLAQIVLREGSAAPRRAFAYFTYWMIVHGAACWLAGRRLPILAVEARCPQPSFCDDYQVMFTENLRFDAAQTRLILAVDGLDAPVRRTAAELRRFLAQAPANILVKYRDPHSLARQLRHLLRDRPAETWPPLEALAVQLGQSVSTLRRRLAAEGQNYQALKDSVRKEQAMRWLADAERPFSDIAERLGFADSSSFYKAFRKWTGASPGQYRHLILGTGQTAQPD